MKGMLTGPVTILCWSFVREDLEREEVCRSWRLPSATKCSIWNGPG